MGGAKDSRGRGEQASLPVEHLSSRGVNGAEGKHGVGDGGGQKREQPEEQTVHGGDQQVAVLGPRGHDGVQHGVDDQVGVLESHLARGQEVLVGELDVLLVEDLLPLLVQFVPDVERRLHPQDVGRLAEVPRLDDADLKVEGEEPKL